MCDDGTEAIYVDETVNRDEPIWSLTLHAKLPASVRYNGFVVFEYLQKAVDT